MQLPQNSSPLDIRNADSGKSFKAKLKTYLLSLSLWAVNASKFSSCWILFYVKTSEFLCINCAIEIYFGLYLSYLHWERAVEGQKWLTKRGSLSRSYMQKSKHKGNRKPHSFVFNYKKRNYAQYSEHLLRGLFPIVCTGLQLSDLLAMKLHSQFFSCHIFWWHHYLVVVTFIYIVSNGTELHYSLKYLKVVNMTVSSILYSQQSCQVY